MGAISNTIVNLGLYDTTYRCKEFTGDLNTIDKTCVYFTSSATNGPPGESNGFITTLAYSSNQAKQTYKPFDREYVYDRQKYNGNWSQWLMRPRYFAGYLNANATASAGNWNDVGYITIPAHPGSTYFTDLIGQVVATTSWNSGRPRRVSICFSTNPNYSSSVGINGDSLYYGCSTVFDVYSGSSGPTYIYFHEIIDRGVEDGICSLHYSGWYRFVTQNQYNVTSGVVV